MTEHEKFLFDLHGYLVIPDALERGQVAKLNQLIDSELPDGRDSRESQRLAVGLNWGKPVTDLIDNPRVFGRLETCLGYEFRLDHIYIDVLGDSPSPITNTLHGGGHKFSPAVHYRYQNGRIRCGMTVVAYNLLDVDPDDGGFACVPGSHKSNFPLPEEWVDLHAPAPCLVRVGGPAGQATLFTEALLHGTLPWIGKGQRRTIFFKYTPRTVSFLRIDQKPEFLQALSKRQRLLLEEAYHRGLDPQSREPIQESKING